MKRHSLGALVAAGLLAGGLSTTSASAADLGGNCCADLEERIAELEATVARKGNRKVSLTISGWVAEQVMWWDDGEEQNTYVTGLGTTLSSHFKFTGEAQIRPGLTAGFLLHIEAGTADPLASLNQDTDEGNATARAFQSYWYLKDDKLGKLSVGQLSPASDNTAILVDGSGSLVPANWVLFDNQAFFVRQNGVRGTVNWGDVAHCNFIGRNVLGAAGDCGGQAGPGNYVRYDSPTFAGFSFSADWGEDDIWDVAARYAGEFNGVKVAFATSYANTTDLNFGGSEVDVGYWQIGGYIQHVATGLFLYGAYGHEETDGPAAIVGALDSSDTWYLKAGLRKRWSALGHTVLFGEYSERNDALDCGVILCDGLGGLANGSELRQWGLGVVQEIDAAAMSIWLVYRNFDGEFSCSGPCVGIDGVVRTSHDFDEMHIVKFGALINF